MNDAPKNLREVKKQITRDSIAKAALKLTTTHGLNHVTLKMIAQEAFVSPRTISNYFSTKEEAVITAAIPTIEHLINDFTHDTAEEHPLHRLREILSNYARENPQQFRTTADIIDLETQNPTLRPYRIAKEAQMVDTLRSRLTTSTSTSKNPANTDKDLTQDPIQDPTRDLYPALVAAAAISALVNRALHLEPHQHGRSPATRTHRRSLHHHHHWIHLPLKLNTPCQSIHQSIYQQMLPRSLLWCGLPYSSEAMASS